MKHNIGRRFFIIRLTFSFSILLLLVFAFRVQVVEGVIYKQRATRYFTTNRIIPAKRGNIYARNNDLLAGSKLFFQVAVVPAKQNEQFRNTFKQLFPDQWENISSILDDHSDSYVLTPVLNRVTKEQLFALVEQLEDKQAVQWYPQLLRDYQFSDSLSHVVGHVGNISLSEYQVRINDGYVQTSNVGKLGVEASYEELLRGTDGKISGRVDATGQLVETFGDIQNEEGGNDIYLTIDPDIQKLAEDALGERTGAVVVMNPRNGEILALVSFPTYDPNELLGNDANAVFASLQRNPKAPFLNRAIQTAVAPASTFKIVTSLALLQKEEFSHEEIIYAGGEFRLGNRIFRCWLPSGHGNQNLRQAFANSSNVYFYTMAHRFLTGDEITQMGLSLGLGTKTGVDLVSEEQGFLPTSEWKERYLNEPWQGGDTVNMSIGQGFITATPMQLASLVSRIANGGTAYKPHILREVRDSNSGRIVERHEPEALPSTDIPTEHWEMLQDMMRKVIVDGTAEVVMTTNATEVAGKTGTGQVGASFDALISWFVSYAPHKPKEGEDQYVVVVMVDSTNEWEWWAPKAANFIFHGIFTEQNLADTVEDLIDVGGLWYRP